MSAAFERRTFAPGEPIFKEGDPGDSLYVVESGRVCIWRGDVDHPTIIGRVETTGIFGEMAIFDRKPRMAHASAETESVLMRMPASVLRESLYGADPLLRQLVQLLIDNIRSMAQQLDALNAKQAESEPS